MQLRFLIAIFAVAALALAGCGDSDSTLTKSELVAQADAICKDATEQLDALPEPQSLADLGELFEKTTPIIQSSIDELQDLQPPSDLQSDYETWMKMMNERLTAFKEVEESAASGSTEEVSKAMEGMQGDIEETDALAKKIGFQECGKSSS